MSSSAAETGARSRTRRAILSAAAREWARNPGATLAEIAEAAEVGRTTLHRYFPDRSRLHRAVIEDSFVAIAEAIEDAAVDQGSAVEAMRRLVTGFVGIGDRMTFLFSVSDAAEEQAKEYEPDHTDRAIADLVERGKAEGVFDPELSAEWVEAVLWSLVYTGYEAMKEGRVPRHGIAATVVRTLENGVCVH